MVNTFEIIAEAKGYLSDAISLYAHPQLLFGQSSELMPDLGATGYYQTTKDRLQKISGG